MGADPVDYNIAQLLSNMFKASLLVCLIDWFFGFFLNLLGFFNNDAKLMWLSWRTIEERYVMEDIPKDYKNKEELWISIRSLV